MCKSWRHSIRPWDDDLNLVGLLFGKHYSTQNEAGWDQVQSCLAFDQGCIVGWKEFQHLAGMHQGIQYLACFKMMLHFGNLPTLWGIVVDQHKVIAWDGGPCCKPCSGSSPKVVLGDVLLEHLGAQELVEAFGWGMLLQELVTCWKMMARLHVVEILAQAFLNQGIGRSWLIFSCW